MAVATPTVLLVDDYDTAGEEEAGWTVIPDSIYTNALAAAGYSYGFWKVIQRGSPQLSDLQPFQVVIWRTTDDIVNYGVDADGLPVPSATNNNITAQQQFMIQSYLNGGGSFFMASMGILSQLGDVPFFAGTLLPVAGFEQNPDPPAPCDDCDEDFGVPAFFGAAAYPSGGACMSLWIMKIIQFSIWAMEQSTDRIFPIRLRLPPMPPRSVLNRFPENRAGVTRRLAWTAPVALFFLSFPLGHCAGNRDAAQQ